MQFEVGEVVLHRLTKERLLIVRFDNSYDRTPIVKVRRFNNKTSTYEDIYCYEIELEKLPEVITDGEETKKEGSESCAKIEQVEEQI